MVTDGQVRKLRHFLDQGIPWAHAARRTGMSDTTARRSRDDARPPSTRPESPRTYRTRPDPFAAVWAEVEERLRAEPRLMAKTLFDWLRQRHPAGSSTRTAARSSGACGSGGPPSDRPSWPSSARCMRPATWPRPTSPA